MLRIRFHGRGGQGMKTASRILGTAAFHAGYVVQDAPGYGAERRGAPMAAFTRIAHAPILERGAIVQADLIVVADDTLLTEPAVQPLAGCESHCTVLVNSTRNEAALRHTTSHSGCLLLLHGSLCCGVVCAGQGFLRWSQMGFVANFAQEVVKRQLPLSMID